MWLASPFSVLFTTSNKTRDGNQVRGLRLYFWTGIWESRVNFRWAKWTLVSSPG